MERSGCKRRPRFRLILDSRHPPEEVRHHTLTLRIHLDNTDEQNGVLKVITDSQNKRLSEEQVALITQSSIPITCKVNCTAGAFT